MDFGNLLGSQNNFTIWTFDTGHMSMNCGCGYQSRAISLLGQDLAPGVWMVVLLGVLCTASLTYCLCPGIIVPGKFLAMCFISLASIHPGSATRGGHLHDDSGIKLCQIAYHHQVFSSRRSHLQQCFKKIPPNEQAVVPYIHQPLEHFSVGIAKFEFSCVLNSSKLKTHTQEKFHSFVKNVTINAKFASRV